MWTFGTSRSPARMSTIAPEVPPVAVLCQSLHAVPGRAPIALTLQAGAS
jgi:hypothetical protein